MHRRYLLVFLGLTTLALVGLILVKGRARYESGAKAFLKDGVEINDRIAQVTRQRWGASPIDLGERSGWRRTFFEAVRFEYDTGIEPEIVEGLKVAILELVEAYSDGKFQTLKEYYLKQTPLINGGLLSKREAQTAEYVETLKKSVDLPLTSRPAKKGEDLNLEKFSPTSEQQLGVLYTNRIKIALVNEIVTSAYKKFDEKELDTARGADVLALVNRAVTEKFEEMERSGFYNFITPWEKVSSELLAVRMVKTNFFANAWQANRELLGGTHRDMDRLFDYRFGPSEMVEEQGAVYYAVFQTAVKPKGMEYFGPITACFFFDQKEKKWCLYQFACHAQIAAGIPF